jgi:hypothetical protein
MVDFGVKSIFQRETKWRRFYKTQEIRPSKVGPTWHRARSADLGWPHLSTGLCRRSSTALKIASQPLFKSV